MDSLVVMLRLWHGGSFVSDREYECKEHLDIPEYDIFEWDDAFVYELVAADLGYDDVGRYAFRTKNNGQFVFVDPNDEKTDFVSLALTFVDDETKILEIFCDCKKEENEEGGPTVEEKGKEKVVEEGGPTVEEKGIEVDVDEGGPTVEEEVPTDSDPDFDERAFEDDYSCDDGLDDIDFSDDDDEFL